MRATLRRLARIAALATTLTGLAAPAIHGQAGDTLAVMQSNDGFNLLRDGQPSPAGHAELLLAIGRSDLPTLEDPVLAVPGILYTPDGSRFLRNLQIAAGVLVEVDASATDLTELNIGWQQRWVADTARMLTFASIVEVLVPTTGGDDATTSGLTGVVAKTFGRSTVYANGLVVIEGAGDATVWSGRAGYRYPIGDAGALVADYIIRDGTKEATQHLLELSGSYAPSGSLTIGPGIQIGLVDNPDTSSFGLGVLLLYTF